MVIIITGPIASGKSTIARELAHELEGTHGRVTVIDLDLVHDALAADGHELSGGDTWTRARHAAATLANEFLAQGMGVVIAEGSFNSATDRAAFARDLHTGVVALYVTLRVSFEEALRRAQDDPTRGISRDPVFLGQYYADVRQTLATLPATDIVIDTEGMTALSAALEIASVVRSGQDPDNGTD